MEALLDRFCRYVRINTQADETARTYPSSPGQLELGRLLAGELRAMGLADAAQDEHGIVLATVPATRQPHGPNEARESGRPGRLVVGSRRSRWRHSRASSGRTPVAASPTLGGTMSSTAKSRAVA